MAYANCRVQISEAPFYDFVDMDALAVTVTKKRMLSENGLDTIALGRQHDAMLQDTGALVPMHDVDVLSDENLTDQRERVEEAEERNVSLCRWNVWKVVHFHSVSHVSQSTSLIFKFVGHKNHFMPAFDQALRQLVCVRLNSTEFWKCEICTN